MKGRKLSTLLTDISYNELMKTIGDKVECCGKSYKIGSLYLYCNKNGIISIRIRLTSYRGYVNVESVCKKQDKVVFVFKER